MSDVDDLVASLPTAHHGTGCWARDLEGKAAEFLEAVKAREQAGEKILRGAIRDVLKREFDITIGEQALRNHLFSRCHCE